MISMQNFHKSTENSNQFECFKHVHDIEIRYTSMGKDDKKISLIIEM